jgi:hypothetical protein
MERGKIISRDYATQVNDFSGLQFERKITPTDVDGLIEFNNEIFILFEMKYKTATLPYGQELALTRIVDAIQYSGKEAALFVCQHEDKKDIDCANSLCSRRYYRHRWYPSTGERRTLRWTIEAFLKYCSQRRDGKNEKHD